MDLKQTLMELGNGLVARGYDPAASKLVKVQPGGSEMFFIDGSGSTLPIVQFVEWLNNDQTAQDVLASLNVEWPMPPSGVDASKPDVFILMCDGAATEFEVIGLAGSMLRVRSVSGDRAITMVIGEQHVRKEERQRFRQCLTSLGCPVALAESQATVGERQTEVGRIGGESARER